MTTKVMLVVKFDVEKFNDKNNFNLWHIKMHDFTSLFKALKGGDSLSKGILNDEEKKDLME